MPRVTAEDNGRKPNRTLRGNDDRGEVFLGDGEVLRAVHADYRTKAKELFDEFERLDLKKMGFVGTRLLDDPRFMFSHDLLLTTYPHEWPSEMLRDAAVFTLDLLETLDRLGLTLKDAIPNNVVFCAGTPCFVDFLSLRKKEDLADDAWLAQMPNVGNDLRKAVLLNMFVPYFLVPLLAMGTGNVPLGRRMLKQQACGQGNGLPSILRVPFSKSALRPLRLFGYASGVATLAIGDYERVRVKARELTCKIKLSRSGAYSAYYAAKGEDFDLAQPDDWMPKQTSVAAFLDQEKPGSVLDIGSNTGWFSKLAFHRGAQVISIDVDEPSLNVLYQDIKLEQLDITPLRLGFGDLLESVSDANGEEYYRAPAERLQCESVMMLALIHHLTLGENRPFKEVFETIGRLCTRSAIVEFVDLDDPLVAGKRSFFRSIGSWNRSTYNLDAALEAARSVFPHVSTMPSHPDRRRMMILRK